MKTVIIIFALIICSGCTLPQSIRKTEWTVAEVKEWYSKKYSNWNGILYQGSDEKLHHFISRVMDDWTFLDIRKEQLKLIDERPYLNSSSGPLGYYYVDPNNDFTKIRDF